MLIAERGSDYAFALLDPTFVMDYWYALLAGYATMFRQDHAEVCVGRAPPLNPDERMCFHGMRKCDIDGVGESQGAFTQIPTSIVIAKALSTVHGFENLYRQFAFILPVEFTGSTNVSVMADVALDQWARVGRDQQLPR